MSSDHRLSPLNLKAASDVPDLRTHLVVFLKAPLVSRCGSFIGKEQLTKRHQAHC